MAVLLSFIHVSLSNIPCLEIQSQRKTLRSLTVHCLSTTLHGVQSPQLANELLSLTGIGGAGNSIALDGHPQLGIHVNVHCPPVQIFGCKLGPATDVATYASLLQRCAIDKALSEGEKVHQQIARHGYADNTFLNNLLVQMYSKCGNLQHSRAVFHNMLYRNLYSWTIMLAVCAQNEHGKEALQLLGQMQAEGFEPDRVTFICVLDACASILALGKGREIHASIVSNGWEPDVVVGTALVHMYGKCGRLDDARAVFAEISQWNVVSWNAMMAACSQNGHEKEALQLFGQMEAKGFEPSEVTFICVLDACGSMAAIEEGQEIHAGLVGNGWDSVVLVENALVNMYGKCGYLDDARAVFKEMPCRDVASWNAMMTVCAQNGHSKKALQLFTEMQEEGFNPDKITCVCILDACASMAALEVGQEIHALVVGNGLESDVVVGNALVNMYGKCGNFYDARAVFTEMPWRDVVSWNGLMALCAESGQAKETIQLFAQMQAEGLEPDKITFSCVLDACAIVTDLHQGREVHGSVVCNTLESDVVMGNALVNMYGKCGSLDDARAVFAEMPRRDVVSWNAIMAVCAQNGNGNEALRLFGQMQAEGRETDKITFICVLTACSHMGLVNDGRRYFTSMSREHGMSPSVDHYVCMVDLLGRAGQLDKAEELINSMPFQSVPSAWSSLLSSCRIHGDVERAIRAANHVFNLEESSASPYVLLANIHAAEGTTWE